MRPNRAGVAFVDGFSLVLASLTDLGLLERKHQKLFNIQEDVDFLRLNLQVRLACWWKRNAGAEARIVQSFQLLSSERTIIDVKYVRDRI